MKTNSPWWYEAKFDELKAKVSYWKTFCLIFILTNVVSLSVLGWLLING